MASSSPPSASAEKTNRRSPSSASEGIPASPTRVHARMSKNSTLGLILFLQIFLISSRGFSFNIDFPQHSTILRILNPRWHAGLFSVPLIFCLWRLLDGRRPTEIRADVVRGWIERDTDVHLIRMIGCIAASTLTGDVVELFVSWVGGLTADVHFDKFGTVTRGGFVLFSMVFAFMMIMLLVSMVWRAVWVPVLIIADGLPQVAAQNFSKRCAEEAKGHLSAVNREDFGDSIREMTRCTREQSKDRYTFE